MIVEGSFLFRKAKIGDRLPDGYLTGDEFDVSAFVLEIGGKILVSACTKGSENHIYIISSFEWNRGYCTIFLKLWEEYAKEKRYRKLIVSEVNDPALEHILDDKRKFYFELDEFQEKTYYKDI